LFVKVYVNFVLMPATAMLCALIGKMTHYDLFKEDNILYDLTF